MEKNKGMKFYSILSSSKQNTVKTTLHASLIIFIFNIQVYDIFLANYALANGILDMEKLVLTGLCKTSHKHFSIITK